MKRPSRAAIIAGIVLAVSSGLVATSANPATAAPRVVEHCSPFGSRTVCSVSVYDGSTFGRDYCVRLQRVRMSIGYEVRASCYYSAPGYWTYQYWAKVKS